MQMVSLHYFIFVIILTDSKDEKKNTKNVFYETDQTFSINYNGVGSVSFLCVRICYKNYKFITGFYEKQHSIEALLIKEISSQLTKKENS